MNRIVVPLVIWILVIAAGFFVVFRIASGTRIVSHGEAAATRKPGIVRFDDPDRYFSSGYQKKAGQGPVVVIGIDGAAWAFIDPLIKRGQLPNLARIKQQGVFCGLRSIPCYVSPPAWTTMFSGCLPEKTGIYTFGKWDRGRREFDSVNATDVRVPRVWDIVSRGGGKVGIFNVPMTWPPVPLNGAVVSGMMTPLKVGEACMTHRINRDALSLAPPESEPASYSSVLRTANSDFLNSYLWSLYDTFDDGETVYDTALLTVISDRPGEDGGYSVRPYLFPVNEYSPWIEIQAIKDGVVRSAWCKKAIFRAPTGGYEARISPTYFQVEEPFTWPESLAVELAEEFEYYSPSVFVAEELVPDFTEEAVRYAEFFYEMDNWDFYAYVFTQSDNIHHLTGYSPGALDVYREIDGFIGDIMDKLAGAGTLFVVSDHGFSGYSTGIELNRYFEKLGLLQRNERDEVDYDNTLVFHNVWHLYFNHDLLSRDELARRGIEVPAGEDPAAFFGRYLQGLLDPIVSEDGTHSVTLELTPLSGGKSGRTPDMLVQGTRGPYVVDFLGLVNSLPSVFYRLTGHQRWWHQREGVFLAWGDGIRRGVDAGVADIQDVAPTLLYLLGLPVADYMDGHVMFGILEQSLMAEQNLLSVETYPPNLIPDPVTQSARQSLSIKLRTLGYLQ